MLESPLLQSYTEDVKEKAKREYDRSIDHKLTYVHWYFRGAFFIASLLMFWKPIAILFLIYPTVDLLFDKVKPHLKIHLPVVKEEMEIYDFETNTNREGNQAEEMPPP